MRRRWARSPGRLHSPECSREPGLGWRPEPERRCEPGLSSTQRRAGSAPVPSPRRTARRRRRPRPLPRSRTQWRGPVTGATRKLPLQRGSLQPRRRLRRRLQTRPRCRPADARNPATRRRLPGLRNLQDAPSRTLPSLVSSAGLSVCRGGPECLSPVAPECLSPVAADPLGVQPICHRQNAEWVSTEIGSDFRKCCVGDHVATLLHPSCYPERRKYRLSVSTCCW